MIHIPPKSLNKQSLPITFSLYLSPVLHLYHFSTSNCLIVMDAAQWPQANGIGVVRGSSSSSPSILSSSGEECSRLINNGEKIKKGRGAERELESLNCPRCKSSNTKFCYYNNYSLSQPRYFCKSCRRYWTAGGTLRNVPVGGRRTSTSRKINKSSSNSKYSSSNYISTTNKPSIPDPSPPKFLPQNPNYNSSTHLTYLPYHQIDPHPHPHPHPPLYNNIDIPFTHLNPQNPNLDTALTSPVSSSGFQLGYFSLENRFGNSQAAVQDYDDSNGFWSTGGSW